MQIQVDKTQAYQFMNASPEDVKRACSYLYVTSSSFRRRGKLLNSLKDVVGTIEDGLNINIECCFISESMGFLVLRLSKFFRETAIPIFFLLALMKLIFINTVTCLIFVDLVKDRLCLYCSPNSRKGL